MQLPVERKDINKFLMIEDINKFLMIADNVLIKPHTPQSRISAGLYLPPTAQRGEKLQCGYIIKTGPGYSMLSLADESEDESEEWKKKDAGVHYQPLQAHEGDLAVYLQNMAYEIKINDEPYMIVPHGAILMLIRDEGLFK
jgi:co-chaperonin GroES (HSP10)